MTKCGFCAIIGAPNAGKSTLTNRLVGAKVAIVSHKVQTTRSRLRGIFNEGDAQVVVVDTPGIFQPKRSLDQAMVSAAWMGSQEADATVFLADARMGRGEDVTRVIDGLKGAKKTKVMLALNKIDLLRREVLLDIAEKFNALFAFSDTFMISALDGSGVDHLRTKIAAAMPEGPWLYPEDQTADMQLRFLASEVTREKIYERLHEELPYASTVETESWEEKPDGSVKITQVIFVERPSQKAIVLGKGGQMAKIIGQMARKELEGMLERRVHLFLFVKVRENWTSDPERLRQMGLAD
jgi:GTPase